MVSIEYIARIRLGADGENANNAMSAYCNTHEIRGKGYGIRGKVYNTLDAWFTIVYNS